MAKYNGYLNWSGGDWTYTASVWKTDQKRFIQNWGDPTEWDTVYYGRLLQAMEPAKVVTNHPPKSQKILGLKALREHAAYLGLSITGVSVSSVNYITTEDVVKQPRTYPLFARGCPLRPRHGFVDSKVVKNTSELQDLWNEVRKADPEGEMLLSPFVESSHNMIWTPTGMAIGPAHDGATAGKESIFMPLIKGPWCDKPQYKKFVEAAKIGHGEVPYVEAVVNKNTFDGSELWVEATQARSGPAIDTLSSNYIPEELEVKEVVVAEGDLMEWEAKAAEFKPGTVVYHPGGTMASHYSVHGVANKIPVLITFEPKVGDILKPTKAIADLDLDLLQKGIIAGHVLPLKTRLQWRKAVGFLLVALHQANAQRGEHSWALGAAASLMTRIGLGLACGELRHFKGSTPMGDYVRGLGRDQVYAQAFNDYFVYRLLYTHTINAYINRKWSNSYGGQPWGACATACAKLDTAVTVFMHDPSAETEKALVNALNSAVNQAHNGGWWLNKIVQQDVMNQAAEASMGSALGAAPVYYDLLKLIKEGVGSNTVGPLLRFIPPVEDEVHLRTMKMVLKVETDKVADVPQKFDLSYPEIKGVPETKLPTLERVQIRPITADNGKPYLRIQMGYFVNGAHSHTERDTMVSAEVHKHVTKAHEGWPSPYHESYLSSGAKYIEWPCKFEVDEFSKIVRGDFVILGEPFAIASGYGGGVVLKKKQVEWWKPGVEIPVTWKAQKVTVDKEVTIPEAKYDHYKALLDNYGYFKQCPTCDDVAEPNNTYCNECWKKAATCDNCGEKNVKQKLKCGNCGYIMDPDADDDDDDEDEDDDPCECDECTAQQEEEN
jgi:hypothetical protein